ncbi:MAG: secretin N-terminal domain-containing protein [Gammaproteobacteria bacterium]
MKLLLSAWLFLICIGIATQVAAESMVLEVIPLKHRTADDIIQILRPLVQPGGTITGMNNQLVVKTTPANLEQIKAVLAKLDNSPRRLLIRVKQGVLANTKQQEQSLSGNIASGDVSVGVNDTGTGNREGLVISGSDDQGNNIRYRGNETRSQSNEGNTFMVNATEGYPAYISIGQSIPVSSETSYVTPGGGVTVNDGTEYINADSGFYVLPRLNGNRVTLLIAPRLTKVGPGRAPILDVQDVETTVTGRLGEWLDIGGLEQQSSSSGQGIASNSRQSDSQSRSVLIKVFFAVLPLYQISAKTNTPSNYWISLVSLPGYRLTTFTW